MPFNCPEVYSLSQRILLGSFGAVHLELYAEKLPNNLHAIPLTMNDECVPCKLWPGFANEVSHDIPVSSLCNFSRNPAPICLFLILPYTYNNDWENICLACSSNNRRRWMCCIVLSHCESVCAFNKTPQFSCLLSSAVDGILLLPGGCQWQEPWKTADNKPQLKGKREKGGQASSAVLPRAGVGDEETMLGTRSLGKRSSEFLCFRWWFINYHHPRGPGSQHWSSSEVPMNEKVGIRGKFAEQKGEMETDGAWERNPPVEERREVSCERSLSFTLRGFMCRRTNSCGKWALIDFMHMALKHVNTHTETQPS